MRIIIINAWTSQGTYREEILPVNVLVYVLCNTIPIILAPFTILGYMSK